MDGQAAVAGHLPVVSFDQSRVQGTGGCNTFGGSYAYAPESGVLRLGDLQSTLMGCLGPEGAFEATFLQAFTGSLQASAVGDQLTFTGPNGVLVLVRTR